MRFVFLVVILTYSMISFAQKSDWGIEAKYKHGFLIAHRPIMSHLAREHTNAFELSLFFQTQGAKNWQKAFNYPIVGVSALGTTVGNKVLLGNYYGAFPFIQFPLVRYKNSTLSMKLGSGVGFTSKVYSENNNLKNTAVSSHVNALINFNLSYNYRLNRNRFSFGLDMTHFSNGASTLPNLGLNLAYFSLGYARNLGTKVEVGKKEKLQLSKGWMYSVIGIYSKRDTYPTGSKKYNIIAFSLSAQKAFRHGVGYESGFDIMYRPNVEQYKPSIYKSAETLWNIGWYNTYFLTFDKMQIHLGMGFYLRDEYFADDRMYHRVGFKYELYKGLLLNLTLKSHWAKADYIEFGLGYRF